MPASNPTIENRVIRGNTYRNPMLRHACCTWLVWLLFASFANAQALRVFELQNGPAKPRVQCLLQHPDGYLLVGTRSGLYAFYGNRFSRLTLDSSLGTMDITAMGKTAGGEIWIGLQNGRLARLTGNSGIALDFEEGHFNAPVTDIMADSLGRVWCATGGEGVYVFSQARWYNINNDDGLSDNYVYDLLSAPGGVVLAATDAGVNALLFTAGKKRVQALTLRDGLADNITTVVTALPDGSFLAGHDENGLTRLELQGGLLRVLPDSIPWNYGRVLALAVAGSEVYVCTADSGVQVRPLSRLRATTALPGLSAGYQLALADNHGNLWLGGGQQLALSLYPKMRLVRPLSAATAGSIHALLTDRSGNTWYAVEHQLYCMGPDGRLQAKPLSLPIPPHQAAVTALYQDSTGTIWIGTMGNGIWLLQPATGRMRPFQESPALRKGSILSIRGRNNRVWVSSLEGAVLCERLAEEAGDGFPLYTCRPPADINSIGTNYIYDILTDSRGRTWFATDGKGITLLDRGRYVHFTEKEGLGNDVVYGLAEDGVGRVWANVLNSGLYFYDAEGRWRHFSEPQGLSGNIISSLLADAQGNVVALGRQVLDVIHARSLGVTSYTAAQGLGVLSSDMHAASMLPDGAILVVTDKGIQRVQTQGPPALPRAYIESVELFLNRISWQQGQQFAAEENNIGIHFDAVHLVQPESVKFQYMLEGLGKTWITTRDRYVNFPKLPPGQYTLKVRASVSNQFALSPVAAYHFTIARPYWQRWWFILLATTGLAALVLALIRYRDRQREHVQQLRQAHLQSQLETLRSQVSPHFFFNSLNTLMSLIEENPKQALQYTAHLSDFFRKVVQIRNEEKILLEEELRLVEDYLFIQQQRFGAGIQLSNKLNADTLHQKKIAPLTLQLLVENAIKHNAFTGQQPLHISLHEQEGYLHVSNNRREKMGREPGAGMGLQNIRHRYALLTAQPLQVHADEAHFRVSIPLLD